MISAFLSCQYFASGKNVLIGGSWNAIFNNLMTIQKYLRGDLSDQDSLTNAMKEQYGVYSVQPIIVDDIEEELRQGR